MKRILAGAFVFGIMVGAAGAEPIKIGVAAEPYPPFAAPNAAGEWEGWEIDVINAVCDAAALDCAITPVAWDGIIPSLNARQIDAIMTSMSITEERLKVIDFSDPYLNMLPVVVADKSMDIEATPDSLSGKVLGVQASTTHQTYAQKHFSDAEIRIYQTQDEANQDLVSGRIDATQADGILMSEFVASEQGSCCQIVGAVEHDEAILGKGIGAGLRKGDDDLREALNKGIATILEDGTHAEITGRYFDSPVMAE